MIREIVETTNGENVELVRPTSQKDIDDLAKASARRNVETGTSLADLQPETDADLETAGVIEPDEPE